MSWALPSAAGGGWSLSLALATAVFGCAPALREPAPLARPADAARTDVDALLRDADAAWSRRAEAGMAERAADLYAAAASADDERTEGLIGAMTALTFQAERETDGASRERLARRAVDLGQWCQRRAPDSAACDYRLALALGQLAREQTSTAHDALGRMVELLRRASTADPRLDLAGPHRILALVELRAPAWPLGPGDPDAALEDARAAAVLFPDAPQNQLALAEALEKNGHADEARAAWERAAELARGIDPKVEPDALRWREEAAKALARGAP